MLSPFARTPDFAPAVVPPEHAGDALFFVFRKNDLLVRESPVGVPRARRAEDLGLRPVRTQYLGALSGTPCFSAELPLDAEAPPGTRFAGLRELYVTLPPAELDVALTAYPVMNFDRTHQFCGACGARTDDVPGERAKKCPACGQTMYPRISPAAIVLVHDGPRVLLARPKGRLPGGWYALVAGFLESGETLEECAAREVREETGVRVDAVEYRGSQPWPFPHQIMVGFFARYAGGEIAIDTHELEDARWFTADTMPPLPPPISIARRMIDAWLETQRAPSSGTAR